MVDDPSLPLQKAIIDRLKSQVAAVAGRVYDRPPPNPVKPYISLGPEDLLPEPVDLYDGADVTLQLDAWSSGPTMMEAKQIGRAMALALDKADLSLINDQRLVSLDLEQVRYLVEPDGVTMHVVLVVRARTEPT